jgi:hypothetical protein
MADAHAMSVPLARWQSIGAFPADGEALNLAYIEPMLRRRLSPLARATLHVARRCVNELDSIQLVYASRHGELQRTVELLSSLATEEVMSPTAFGLSVLNSVPGIFSIARGDFSPSTAISAAEETFGFGLIDAMARARVSRQPVLYLYADAPAPSPLCSQPADPADFLVTGMLLDPDVQPWLTVATRTVIEDAACEPQAVSCMRAIAGSATSWSSGSRRWTWARLE